MGSPGSIPHCSTVRQKQPFLRYRRRELSAAKGIALGNRASKLLEIHYPPIGAGAQRKLDLRRCWSEWALIGDVSVRY